MRYLYTLLLVAALSVGAFAQSPSADKPDARLDQKVTLEVSHVKLEDVCRQLTDMTGVTIKAGSGERDWKVRERRVTIQAKDVKLGTLMQEISKLLGFYLSKSGKEGEWAYLYWQDKKSRDLEAEMLNAEKEAAAQRARKLCQSAIDQAAEALKLSPEEALKQKSKDPCLAYMGGSKSGRGFAQLLASLGASFPTELELMLRGQRITIPMSGAPSIMRQAAIDTAAGGIIGAQAKAQGANDLADMEPYQLEIVPVSPTDDFEAGMLGLGGIIAVTGVKPGEKPGNGAGWLGDGQPMGVFVLMDPKSKVAGMFANMLFDIEGGADVIETNRKLNEEVMKPEVLASLLEKESPTEKEPPTDPRLTREVDISEKITDIAGLNDLESKPESAGKTLAEVSRAIGMPVLMESFPKFMPPSIFIKPGKQPLYKVLIGFEKADMGWELSDDALRVRPRDWALRRSYEIPESFMAYYRDLLEKQGAFTLDDIAAIAMSLTDGQIGNTLLSDPDLTPVLQYTLGDLGESRSIIRFYGSLTDQQKATVESEDGLIFSQLTSEQWERLSTLITDKFGGVYVVDGSVRSVGATATDHQNTGATVSFTISVQVADEKEPRLAERTVIVPDKEQIAQIRKQHQAMEERRKKAKEEKERQESPAK